MKNTESAFNFKAFIRAVAVIAVPVALQNLLTTTGSMVDTMMVAPLGETTVGALGLCAQFSSLMFSCYWGFVGGGMLFFAQYYGAKDEDGVCRAYGITFSFMMTVAAIFMVLGRFFPQQVMSVYTDKAHIAAIGVAYLRVVAFAYPLQIFSVCMCALLRSTERVRIPMFGAFASVGTNVLLNWMFIYGKLGLPAMGVKGAALATVCAAVVNVLVIWLLALGTGYRYLFRFRSHFRFTGAFLREYLYKCFPILCNELLIGVGFTVLNIVLGRQQEEAIAAIAVFRTMEGLVISFFAGFSNAASVLIGNRVGAGDLRGAYEYAKRLILLCGGCVALVCATLFALHRPLLRLMSLSGESLRLGTIFLSIYCVAAVIRMSNWAQNDTFRAAGDARTGTVLEISFMYAVVLPAVCLTGLVFRAPVALVFLCCYIDEPIRFILMQRHLYSGKWIRPVTQAGKKALPGFLEELKKGKR